MQKVTPELIAEIKSRLRKLKELEGHPGWKVIVDVIEKDVLNAALAMADNPVMTEKEIDFRRGAIHAARNTVSLLANLIHQTENELLLASAELQQTQTNPDATA